jgi:hypothetical protein
MSSAFISDDKRLSLSTLMSKSTDGAELAFLSACHTATGDENREAVHLAAAMLVTGFKSVVGTMWSVHDHDAPMLPTRYARLVVGGKFSYGKDAVGGCRGSEMAYALHEAISQLREQPEVGEKGFLW